MRSQPPDNFAATQPLSTLWASQRRSAFTALEQEREIDFSEAMNDPELHCVVRGMKIIMAEAGLDSMEEFAKFLGHHIIDLPGHGAMIAPRERQNGVRDDPIGMGRDASQEEQEFLFAHEMGHAHLFSPYRHSFQPQESLMEVYCDAFACLMVGLDRLPENYER